jgi:hypothetical protein
MQGVDYPANTSTRPDGAKADRSFLRLLIQAYCFFPYGGAACEAAAAPACAFVSGSARNLPIICGTFAEVIKLQ